MYLNSSSTNCDAFESLNTTATQAFLRRVSLLFDSDVDRISLIYLRVLTYVRTNCSLAGLEHAVNQTYERVINDYMEQEMEKERITLLYSVGTIWVLIGLIGLIGNVFVLVVLCRNDNKLVYEVFCIGLATTDLIFLCLAVPMTIIHYVFDSWLFGAFFCKLANYIVVVTVYAASLMLLGLTTSRFLAVVHPWKNRKIKVGRAKLACVGAWLIGITCSLPVLILYTLIDQSDDEPMGDDAQNRTLCVDHGLPSEVSRAAYQIFMVMVTCIVPFSSIIVMNSMIVLRLQKEVNKSDGQRTEALSCREQRKKKLRAKVTKLVIIVTTLYCVCWVPTHMMNTWYNVFRSSFPQTKFMMILKTISQSLSYASCCINPIVYSAISGSFKAAIFKQFPRLSRMFRQDSTGEVDVNRTELVTYRTQSVFRACRSNEGLNEEERTLKESPRLLKVDKKQTNNRLTPSSTSSPTSAIRPSKPIQTNGMVAVVVVAGQSSLDEEPEQEEKQTENQPLVDLSNSQQQTQNSVSAIGGAKRPTSLPGQPRHQKHSSGSTASASNDPHSSVPSITWSSGSPVESEQRNTYLRMSAV